MKKFVALFMLAALAGSACIARAGSDLPLVYHHSQSLAAHTGGAIRLDLDSQDVRMRVRPGNTVEVTVTVRGDADDKQKLIGRYVPTIRAEGNDVVIRGPRRHNEWNWFGFSNRTRALVEVALPPDMDVHFKLDSGDFDFDGSTDRATLAGRVDSGDVRIRAASRRLTLDADSGDVRVELSQPAKSVRIEADSGDIHFQGGAQQLRLDADSGDIVASGRTGNAELDADSGDIRIEGLRGSLRAKADSGDVSARWRKLAADSDIRIHTDSGDVAVMLPADANVKGSLTTERGELDSDFAGRFNDEHTRLELAGKPGAVPVRIETEGGDISLNKG